MERWVWDKLQQCREDTTLVWEKYAGMAEKIGCEKAYMHCAMGDCRKLWDELMECVPEKKEVIMGTIPDEEYENLQRLCARLRQTVRNQNQTAYQVLEVLKGKIHRQTTTIDYIHNTLNKEIVLLREQLFRMYHPDSDTEFSSEEFSLIDFVKYADNSLKEAAGAIASSLKEHRVTSTEVDGRSSAQVSADHRANSRKRDLEWQARLDKEREDAQESTRQHLSQIEMLRAQLAVKSLTLSNVRNNTDTEVSKLKEAHEQKMSMLGQETESKISAMAEERDLQSTEVRERLESQLHNLVRRQTLQQKESETEARLRDQMYEETASEHLADQEQSSQHHKRQIDAARKEIETIKQRNAIQQQNMILEWQTVLKGMKDDQADELGHLAAANKDLFTLSQNLANELATCKEALKNTERNAEVRARTEAAKMLTDDHQKAKAIAADYALLLEKYEILKTHCNELDSRLRTIPESVLPSPKGKMQPVMETVDAESQTNEIDIELLPACFQSRTDMSEQQDSPQEEKQQNRKLSDVIAVSESLHSTSCVMLLSSGEVGRIVDMSEDTTTVQFLQNGKTTIFRNTAASRPLKQLTIEDSLQEERSVLTKLTNLIKQRYGRTDVGDVVRLLSMNENYYEVKNLTGGPMEQLKCTDVEVLPLCEVIEMDRDRLRKIDEHYADNPLVYDATTSETGFLIRTETSATFRNLRTGESTDISNRIPILKILDPGSAWSSIRTFCTQLHNSFPQQSDPVAFPKLLNLLHTHIFNNGIATVSNSDDKYSIISLDPDTGDRELENIITGNVDTYPASEVTVLGVEAYFNHLVNPNDKTESDESIEPLSEQLDQLIREYGFLRTPQGIGLVYRTKVSERHVSQVPLKSSFNDRRKSKARTSTISLDASQGGVSRKGVLSFEFLKAIMAEPGTEVNLIDSNILKYQDLVSGDIYELPDESTPLLDISSTLRLYHRLLSHNLSILFGSGSEQSSCKDVIGWLSVLKKPTKGYRTTRALSANRSCRVVICEPGTPHEIVTLDSSQITRTSASHPYSVLTNDYREGYIIECITSSYTYEGNDGDVEVADSSDSKLIYGSESMLAENESFLSIKKQVKDLGYVRHTSGVVGRIIPSSNNNTTTLHSIGGGLAMDESVKESDLQYLAPTDCLLKLHKTIQSLIYWVSCSGFAVINSSFYKQVSARILTKQLASYTCAVISQRPSGENVQKEYPNEEDILMNEVIVDEKDLCFMGIQQTLEMYNRIVQDIHSFVVNEGICSIKDKGYGRAQVRSPTERAVRLLVSGDCISVSRNELDWLWFPSSTYIERFFQKQHIKRLENDVSSLTETALQYIECGRRSTFVTQQNHTTESLDPLDSSKQDSDLQNLREAIQNISNDHNLPKQFESKQSQTTLAPTDHPSRKSILRRPQTASTSTRVPILRHESEVSFSLDRPRTRVARIESANPSLRSESSIYSESLPEGLFEEDEEPYEERTDEESQSETQSRRESQSETQSRRESQSETQSRRESQSETQSRCESQSETQSRRESQSETQSRCESQSETLSGHESQCDTRSEALFRHESQRISQPESEYEVADKSALVNEMTPTRITCKDSLAMPSMLTQDERQRTTAVTRVQQKQSFRNNVPNLEIYTNSGSFPVDELKRESSGVVTDRTGESVKPLRVKHSLPMGITKTTATPTVVPSQQSDFWKSSFVTRKRTIEGTIGAASDAVSVGDEIIRHPEPPGTSMVNRNSYASRSSASSGRSSRNTFGDFASFEIDCHSSRTSAKSSRTSSGMRSLWEEPMQSLGEEGKRHDSDLQTAEELTENHIDNEEKELPTTPPRRRPSSGVTIGGTKKPTELEVGIAVVMTSVKLLKRVGKGKIINKTPKAAVNLTSIEDVPHQQPDELPSATKQLDFEAIPQQSSIKATKTPPPNPALRYQQRLQRKARESRSESDPNQLWEEQIVEEVVAVTEKKSDRRKSQQKITAFHRKKSQVMDPSSFGL